jgi:hypothetical protein
MVRWMVVRVFSHMLGMACGMVMEYGMLGFLRQRPGHHTGQE